MELRRGGRIYPDEYKGKTLEEATKYAKDGGFQTRIVEIDGKHNLLDMGVVSNRINFRVREGIVTDAYTG
jgi:hypothetical protein